MSFAAVAHGLKAKAKRLAETRTELRLRAGSAQRWRDARLLWPLFTDRR